MIIMEKTSSDLPNTSAGLEEQSQDENCEELLSTLPTAKAWNGSHLYRYQGFWYLSRIIHGLFSCQRHFQAEDSDIILASFPKSGTTWLKALAFAIVNRSRYPLENSPLLTNNPHSLVRFLDLELYNQSRFPNLEELPRPRIFAVHLSFNSLPPSIMNSSCRIVYICRNPFDQFISHWIFLHKLKYKFPEPVSLDEAFDMFCNGVQAFGPFWDHVLGYWNASFEQPHKILFLKYEDLQDDIVFHVKKLAEFLGCPFSEDEENQGMVEQISKLCSFDNMKNLEVNKTGEGEAGLRANVYFHKAKVGDWVNYLTPSMVERLEKLAKEKLDGSGLTFKTL